MINTYMDFKRREQRNAKIEKLVYGTIMAVGVAAIGYFGIKPEIENWKYNHAPLIEYTVQKGDNVEKLLRAEGINSNEELAKCMKIVKEANDIHVGWNQKWSLNNIKEGWTLLIPDVNKDGKVGVK